MSRSLLQKLRPYYIRKALRYLRHYGPKDFAVRVRERLTPDDVPYGPWLAEHSPDADALKAQRKEEFDGSVKFSVLVPVWNTPEIYFREMADSVLGQTYPHLELVIADASPENKELSSLLKIYEERDSRVKLVRLEENGGIARNTNAGAAACTGDFICFLDHDDMLAPNALYETAKALRALGEGSRFVQMIYTDEDKMRFGSSGVREYFQPHFKPDFNLDLLRSNNYICHLLMVRRELFQDAGGIDPSFEGAQDHEFILRCVDRIFGRDLKKPGYPGRLGQTPRAEMRKEFFMDQIARIESMEKKLDDTAAAVHALSAALDAYLGVAEDIAALESYLSSPEWREDLAADEKGLLPAALKRGVLSEDGIYDLLEENGELLKRLREIR